MSQVEVNEERERERERGGGGGERERKVGRQTDEKKQRESEGERMGLTCGGMSTKTDENSPERSQCGHSRI